MVLSLLTVFGYMCVCMWLMFSRCDEFFSLQVVGALTSVILFVSVFLSTFACVSVCERKFKTKKYIGWWCVGVILCVNVCLCVCMCVSVFLCVNVCERKSKTKKILSGKILYENVSVCRRLITVFDRGK